MDTVRTAAACRRSVLLGGAALLLILGAAAPLRAQVPLSQRSVVRDPDFRFRKPVFSWQEIKHRHVVMQQRDYSCGAAALATVLRYYWGHDVNEAIVLNVVEDMLTDEQLRERESEGLTMADVKDAAIEMGYNATVGEVTFSELTESKVPVIVVVDIGGTNHFVVYRGVSHGCVFLADPIRGNLRISAAQFQRTWQRNAILVVAPEGETQSDRSRLGITYDELIRGYLNRQLIRRATSQGLTSFPRGMLP